MKSMTGYAKRQCIVQEQNVTVEIKTLNSKQIDIITKIPSRYRSHEIEIRSMLNQLERGKIEFVLTEERSETVQGMLNKELVKQRYEAVGECVKELRTNCTISSETILRSILQQPDIWDNGREEELTDEQWERIKRAIEEAMEEVDETRLHEGSILEEDFKKHLTQIEEKLNTIPQYEEIRIENAKERIRNWMKDWCIREVDENRFEQELIYYLEKLDITEEKVRLAKHINYFRQVMAEEAGSGKKLGFIAQEMGREINTTGSKANQVDIQKLVVEMKDELEKIKEQLGNIL